MIKRRVMDTFHDPSSSLMQLKLINMGQYAASIWFLYSFLFFDYNNNGFNGKKNHFQFVVLFLVHSL